MRLKGGNEKRRELPGAELFAFQKLGKESRPKQDDHQRADPPQEGCRDDAEPGGGQPRLELTQLVG